MYVSRIRIDNSTCFRGERAVDLDLTRPDGTHSGWTVLAGPNGSGKTTLLEAVARQVGETDGFCASFGPARGTEPGDCADLPREALALLDDGLLPDGYRATRADTGGLRVELDGAEHPLGALGSGCAAVVSLVVGLLRQARQFEPDEELIVGGPDTTPVAPIAGVVLIDDAEAHLHLGWQQRLGDWLVAHFPNVQFIVATHSPYICQSADPGGLVRLAGPTEAAPPRVLDEELHQRIVYGSGDDAALSELFGLPSAYSPQAEAERRLLIDLERKLYAGQATSSEIAEYEVLGAKLNSSLTARVEEFRDRLSGER
ncbi:AAA family ATPase [Kitasatospora sp. McL0602]|uniref:AAA family ATPase n=1 Tax=Kitasatospora sp. McL0602 TaxID=3439530 RepID=UPI003F8BD0C3